MWQTLGNFLTPAAQIRNYLWLYSKSLQRGLKCDIGIFSSFKNSERICLGLFISDLVVIDSDITSTSISRLETT